MYVSASSVIDDETVRTGFARADLQTSENRPALRISSGWDIWAPQFDPCDAWHSHARDLNSVVTVVPHPSNWSWSIWGQQTRRPC